MASRALSDLEPDVEAKARAFLDECAACGLSVLIYCTLRSNAEQDLLYSVGRTRQGRILTNARAGQSLHNPRELTGKARAFDAVPMVGGKPQWADLRLLGLMGGCGEAVGLEWAGRWSGKLKEYVHFQAR